LRKAENLGSFGSCSATKNFPLDAKISVSDTGSQAARKFKANYSEEEGLIGRIFFSFGAYFVQ